MAKFPFLLFFLLAGFLDVEGLTIEFPMPRNDGRNTGPDIAPNVTLNDPRCQGRNGIFPNPRNCKAYYACRDGTGQDRLCPEGMTFHPQRHCTLEANTSCLETSVNEGRVAPRVSCPSYYGMFAYPPNCHKYLVCTEGVPEVRTCPDNFWYQENVGCMEAKSCPQ